MECLTSGIGEQHSQEQKTMDPLGLRIAEVRARFVGHRYGISAPRSLRRYRMISVEVRPFVGYCGRKSTRTLKASHTMIRSSAIVAAGGHGCDVPAFRTFRTLTTSSTVLRMAFFRFPDESPEECTSDIVDRGEYWEVMVQMIRLARKMRKYGWWPYQCITHIAWTDRSPEIDKC